MFSDFKHFFPFIIKNNNLSSISFYQIIKQQIKKKKKRACKIILISFLPLNSSVYIFILSAVWLCKVWSEVLVTNSPPSFAKKV